MILEHKLSFKNINTFFEEDRAAQRKAAQRRILLNQIIDENPEIDLYELEEIEKKL